MVIIMTDTITTMAITTTIGMVQVGIGVTIIMMLLPTTHGDAVIGAGPITGGEVVVGAVAMVIGVAGTAVTVATAADMAAIVKKTFA